MSCTAWLFWSRQAISATPCSVMTAVCWKADVSTIVPLIEAPVTSFQHTAVITEQGVAEIAWRDQKSQAVQLIEHAAHPAARDDLWEEAQELGLL